MIVGARRTLIGRAQHFAQCDVLKTGTSSMM